MISLALVPRLCLVLAYENRALLGCEAEHRGHCVTRRSLVAKSGGPVQSAKTCGSQWAL